jgi:hypothetical protein
MQIHLVVICVLLLGLQPIDGIGPASRPSRAVARWRATMGKPECDTNRNSSIKKVAARLNRNIFISDTCAEQVKGGE